MVNRCKFFNVPFQLTTGLHQTHPVIFSYDFKKLTLTKENPKIREHFLDIIKRLKVKDTKKQKLLKKSLGATFHNNYIAGYFETILTKEYGLWFIDFNRILGEAYQDFSLDLEKSKKQKGSVLGRVGSPGQAKGTVHLIKTDNIFTTILSDDAILV